MLWRLDSDAKHELNLYVVSAEAPSFDALAEQAGWSSAPVWRTADYGRFLERLASGQRWVFRLVANPIRNVRDVYGNAIAAPLSWEFFVGGDVASQDFDRDGVIDALDLCQGFNDKIDTDLDGIPDGCDLCKDKTNAGINFDGIDDYITGFEAMRNGSAGKVVMDW